MQLIQPEEGLTRIEGYSYTGFVIDQSSVEGSVVVYKNCYLMWDAKCLRDITPEFLAPLLLLAPQLELIIFGTGRILQFISADTHKFLFSQGVALYPAATHHALSTFNILAQEGRHVAAAMLPASCYDTDWPHFPSPDVPLELPNWG